MSAVLTIVETHASHLASILAHPSDITAREIERCGLSSWTLMKSLNELLKAPGARADTLRIDGVPSMIFGHNPIINASGRRATWFVSKQQYFDLGPRGVVFARQYMRRLHGIWPGTAFDSFSYSDHPDLKRWFEALGFRQSYDYDVPSGCTKFTFWAKLPEKAKKDDSARVS